MKKYTSLALLAILASGSAMATYGPSYDPIAKINQVNTANVASDMREETVTGGKNVDKSAAAGNTAVVKSGHVRADQLNTQVVTAANAGNTLQGSNSHITNAAGNAITMGSKDDKPKAKISQTNSAFVDATSARNKLVDKNELETGAAGNNVNLLSGKLKSTQSNTSFFVSALSNENQLEGTNKMSTDAYGNQIVMGAKKKDPKAKIIQNNGNVGQFANSTKNKLNGHNTMDTVAAGNTVTQTSGKLKAYQENIGTIRAASEINTLAGVNVVANYGAGNAITMGQ